MADTREDASHSTYVIGHTKGVTNAHAARSLARSCKFLLPHLRPDMRVLDVGCGPGSITCDIAALVPQGHVTGVDLSPAVLEQARATSASKDLSNMTFMPGNILSGLPFPDASFDLVFCHQLLNHLSDPAAGLREMARLAKPDGLVAVREGICHIWYPDDPGLADMDQILATTMRASGAAEPGVGRRLPFFAEQAGLRLEKGDFTVSGAPVTGPAGRERMKNFFVDTFSEGSMVRKMAIRAGVDEGRVQKVLEAGIRWAGEDGAFETLVSGEIVCCVKAAE